MVGVEQPLTCSFDVGVGAARAAKESSHRRDDTPLGTPGGVEVDGEGEVAGSRHSSGVAAHDVVDAEDLVDQYDPRPRPLTFGSRQVAA